MNFKSVQQGNGQNVIMQGRILEFKGEGVGTPSNPNGKPWKKVKAQDQDGEVHTVTIRGNLPPVDAVNKPASFTISTFQGTYQGQPYTGYSGFCDVLPDYGPPQQTYGGQQPPSPQPRQAPSQPRQSTNAEKPDWDAKDRHIVRQNTLNRAVEIYLHANPEVDWPELGGQFEQIVQLAEDFRTYVYNGLPPQVGVATVNNIRKAADEAQEKYDQTRPVIQDDSEIPF